jgi:uncharacterized protein
MKHKTLTKPFKILILSAGFMSLSLGIAGIFLPLLPATPFLLLSAFCFAKSSEKFYQWLILNRVFGSYIQNYREKRGIPLKAKIMSVSLLWISIFSSIILLKNICFSVILPVIALLVSIHLLRMKTYRETEIVNTKMQTNEPSTIKHLNDKNL